MEINEHQRSTEMRQSHETTTFVIFGIARGKIILLICMFFIKPNNTSFSMTDTSLCDCERKDNQRAVRQWHVVTIRQLVN